MSNIGWVQIPVLDTARSANFYNTVFGWTLSFETIGRFVMAPFPSSPDNVGGALVYDSAFRPSSNGVLVYFLCSSASGYAEKTERAGGRIVTPATPFPTGGYYSVVVDTEGNHIGFYCP